MQVQVHGVHVWRYSHCLLLLRAINGRAARGCHRYRYECRRFMRLPRALPVVTVNAGVFRFVTLQCCVGGACCVYCNDVIYDGGDGRTL